MSRRFRPTDAFVDETGDKSRRVHFNAELDSRRLSLLQRFADLPIEAFVVICRRRHGVTEFEARSRCIETIIAALQLRTVDRLVITKCRCPHTTSGARLAT